MVAAHVRGACEAIRGGSIPLPGTFSESRHGRLAQLVERPVYIRQVRGPSPLAATKHS